jgi:hypothetical protein
MAKALDIVDGIGLARSTCQEPRLANEIVDGKVTGVLKLKLDDNDFGLTTIAAGTQINQMGKNQEPIDLSVQENVDVLMQHMQAWGRKLGSDKDMKEYGYIDLTQGAEPYGAG